MNENFRNAFRSLLKHKLRSFLSMLGIVFGVVAVITMLSIGEGAQQETLSQISQLGVNTIIIRQYPLSDEQKMQAAAHRARGLTLDDMQALKKNLPMLARLAPLKIMKETITGSFTLVSPEVLSVTPEFGEMRGLQLQEGRFFCSLDYIEKKNTCVIGSALSERLGSEGHVGGLLRLGRAYYTIVGVLQPLHWKGSEHRLISSRNLDNVLLLPLHLEKVNKTEFSKEKEDFSEIILQISDSSQVENAFFLVKMILGKLHGGYEDYQIVVPQELLRQAHRTQRTFNVVLGAIALLSLLVGGIGIMNIMLATVFERTREIGIRRAVGASKQHILFQFLLETIVLTAIGAFIGIIAGMFFSSVINSIVGWKTIITVWSVFLSLIMAMGVGILSGYYPAYRASAMDPIAALRYD